VPSSKVILRSYGQWLANMLALDLLKHVHKVMIVFGNRVHVNRGFGCGRGMTSDLRE